MALAAWIDLLQKKLWGSSVHAAHRPLSTLDFQRAALCERMRVDRNGSVLSVLAIALPVGHDSNSDQSDLHRHLADRLRITDTIGTMPDGRIGVLLPDTPESGAWKVASDLCDNYPVGPDRPNCEVFLYPDGGEGDLPVALPEEQPTGDDAIGAGRPARCDRLFIQPPSKLKRMTDIAGAAFGLTLAAPIIAVAAVAIRLNSPGSPIFRQEREGLGGKRFTMYKLRTMRADADKTQTDLREYSIQDGPAFKMVDDPRTTPVGRFLRKTSLDELPQLWNVLRGDMSLVGPRPLPTAESLECKSWQRQRLSVLPGLTCIWQVHGRNIVTFDEWIRMDLRYIRRKSFWYDLKLIFETCPSILLPKGPR